MKILGLKYLCLHIASLIRGGWALGAEAPPHPTFTFRLYLINMLRIITKFCLSIII